MKYAITVTFETDAKIPKKALNDIAGCALVQLEGLDYRVPYRNEEVRARRLKPSTGQLENALRCLTVRFPLEGWAHEAGMPCKCNQYADHGECRHTMALKALDALDKKRA